MYNHIDKRAIDLWVNSLYSLRMIGSELGVSAAGVKKYLNRHGIATGGGALLTVCGNPGCGKEFSKARCYLRIRKRNFCSDICYYEVLGSSGYQASRQGQRVARRLVRECGFSLEDGHVVHHRDGDCDNNDLGNLLVFSSQSDHMRWHRLGGIGSGVVPIFGSV
uniref:Putative homing endonuclease n=1 Tax=viral metagenome TaxID=1070528 RepID=A0A6H2A343_9ZZZZ